MGSPLLTVPWEECFLAPAREREAEAYLKREVGSAPAWSRYFWSAPWFAKAMIRLPYDHGLLIELDFATADLAGLVVSQENSCRYCYAAARAMMRVLGLSEARMQALEKRLALPDLDPRGAAAVRFARRMARANPLAGAADRDALRTAGFTAGEIREFAFAVAVTTFFNRLSTIPALPPKPWEGAPDGWVNRLFRPIAAAVTRRWRTRASAAPHPIARMPASFQALLRVYEGSPIGPVLAETFADLWDSPILPKRTKALMFAVIAQGLGCPLSRDEACALLLADGFQAEKIATVLSHLGGEGLADDDAALLGFARDSIWYEPQPIQKRARALHQRLGPARFVEALGVVSFGNAVCRLAAVMLERP